jgi:hypothetical protein
MSTRTDNDVLLSHVEASAVAKILDEYASARLEHARKTKNAAVKFCCEQNAFKARELANKIAKSLSTWS